MVVRQRDRVRGLQATRLKDPSFTWRRLLLGHNSHKQDRLIQAMRDANLPDHVVERTNACAAHAFVYKNVDTQEHRIRHFTCHNRFCLLCQASYTRHVREKALSLVPAAKKRLSFLTLTQRAVPDRDLRHAIATLLKSFRALRRTTAWVERVTGGLYVIEVTRGASGDWWHAHLHSVIDTGFWELELLHKLWSHACGETAYVHIEAVEQQRQHFISHYLSKYLTKQFSDDLYDDPLVLAAFVATMRGRRMIQAFGTWAPAAMLKKAQQAVTRKKYAADQWIFVGELHDLLTSAEGGSIAARRTLTALGFTQIQLRSDARSEIDRFWESRAPPQPTPDILDYSPAA